MGTLRNKIGSVTWCPRKEMDGEELVMGLRVTDQLKIRGFWRREQQDPARDRREEEKRLKLTMRHPDLPLYLFFRA